MKSGKASNDPVPGRSRRTHKITIKNEYRRNAYGTDERNCRIEGTVGR